MSMRMRKAFVVKAWWGVPELGQKSGLAAFIVKAKSQEKAEDTVYERVRRAAGEREVHITAVQMQVIEARTGRRRK